MSSEDSKLFRTGRAGVIPGQCPNECSANFHLFAWNHPSHCCLQSDSQWCSEVLVKACLCSLTLDLLCRTLSHWYEGEGQPGIFPRQAPGRSHGSAVHSLLKKNNWNILVLGPCCSTAPSWWPEALQKAEEAPQKWHISLRRGYSLQRFIFLCQ